MGWGQGNLRYLSHHYILGSVPSESFIDITISQGGDWLPRFTEEETWVQRAGVTEPVSRSWLAATSGPDFSCTGYFRMVTSGFQRY